MAFTLDITSFSAPANPAASQGASGSGDLDDGTYYIVITALDAEYFQNFTVTSPPSEEISVVCSQGNGNNSIDVSWDAVTDAVAYNVHVSTVSEDYAGSKKVKRLSDGSYQYATVTTNSASITVKSYLTGYSWEMVNWGTRTPGKLSKNIGYVKVNFWGTGTFEDLMSALETAVPDNIWYDGRHMFFAGTWEVSGSNDCHFTAPVLRKFLTFVGGQFSCSNTHADTVLQFGELENGIANQHGCVFEFIKWEYNNFKIGNKIKTYGCFLKHAETTDRPVYSANKGTMYLRIEGTAITGSMIACDEQPNVPNGLSDVTFIGGLYPEGNLTDITNYNFAGDVYRAIRIYSSVSGGRTLTRIVSYSRSDGTGTHIRDLGGTYSSPLTIIDSWFNSATGKPNGLSKAWVQFIRKFNIEVIAEDTELALSGVTVNMKDSSDSFVWTEDSETTGADGRLAAFKDVMYWEHAQDAGGTYTEKGPFKVILSKDGYATLTIPDVDLNPSTDYVEKGSFLMQVSLPLDSGGADIEIEVNSGRLMKRVSDQLMLQI